jgi:fructokinase
LFYQVAALNKKYLGRQYMKYDAVALGELLVDFTPAGASIQGNLLFEANPGGAPCNVLAMMAKLGCRTAFIGKVGDDIHGRQLRAAIRKAGIDSTYLISDSNADTTLAFVALNDDGDRDFSFYRRPGADTTLRPEDISKALLQETRLLHFGSLSLTHQPARQATQLAVQYAKELGLIISFDPNFRAPLWDSRDEAVRQMLWGCGQADIVKLAIEELAMLLGNGDTNEIAAKMLKSFSNIRILLVTDGKNGASAYWQDKSVNCPTYLNVETVDTTGAGDTFLGSCLSQLLGNSFEALTIDSMRAVLRFSNAAASLVTTRKGALLAMPDRDEIETLIRDDQ